MYVLVSKNNYHSNKLYQQLQYHYNFTFISKKEDLNTYVKNNNPDKIFFFHWSYIIPDNIINNHTCINIHTSNLPDGKGGSPLQNQIIDGIINTKVNALKMTNVVDGGPLYNSIPITLQGNLFDIWGTIRDASYHMILDIIENNLEPRDQMEDDNFVKYKRRYNNEIPFKDSNELTDIYDFIRMLDCDGYPNAYMIIGNYKLEFSRASFDGSNIISDVKIKMSN